MKITHLTVPAKSNAGDLLLSDSVRVLFDYVWGKQDWNVHNLRSLATQKLIDDINDSDGLILGGGGLFLKDTNRNNNSGWQWNCPISLLTKINVPFGIFGVGYNRFRGQGEFEPIFKKHINTVAKKCFCMGLRNHGSIDAISNYIGKTNKLRFQPCSTTLCREIYNLTTEGAWSKGDKTIGFTIAFDRSNLRFGKKESVILENISKAMLWCSKNGWNVKIINQHDNDMRHPWLKIQSKEYEVLNTCYKNPKEVVSMYNDIALLVGMRGHSQLIPFGVNNAFISIISHDKLKFFLDDIGHPEWGIEARCPNITEEIISKIQHMDKNRQEIQHHINTAKDYLWGITKDNLEYFRQNFVSN